MHIRPVLVGARVRLRSGDPEVELVLRLVVKHVAAIDQSVSHNLRSETH